MSFETLDFLTAKGLVMIFRISRDNSVCQENQEKENLSRLTRRQTAFVIYAFFKINDVQRRIIGMNERKVKPGRISFQMALEKEPEDECLESLFTIDNHRKMLPCRMP